MEQQLNLFGEKIDYIVRKNEKNVLPLHNPNDTKKMSSQGKVVKEYKEIPPVTDFIRFGNDFVDEFLSGKEATKLSINALKIIFNIISQLRNEQFQHKNQPRQLSLFEEEFASEDNLFAKISIKKSLITSNTEELKKAYRSLALYKFDHYKFITSDGDEVEALGGLIRNVYHNKTKGYSTFEISSYWMKRILQIDAYNKTLYNLVYNIRSNKHVLFSFWLSRLPMEGTSVKFSTLNDYFDVNYSTARDLCKDFLKAVRSSLDKYSPKSFNYNYLGDLITIKPYFTQYVEAEATKTNEAKEEIKSNYKLRYYKDRHQLSDEELTLIKFIYERDKSNIETLTDAYELFIEECRKKKKKATEYIGREFLKEFQIYVDKAYAIKHSRHLIKYANLRIEKCYIRVIPRE